MYTCRISGLAVRAEMELPGVVPAQVQDGQEDVRICRTSVPERLGKPTSSGRYWEMDGRQFLLWLPGIGRFLARDGETLEIDTEPGTDLADAIPFLLGTAFGAILLQRGGLVLHAASVAFNGRGYVFCGHSGIGKSTLAAALCRSGCLFVNDDVCAIGLDEAGAPQLWPDGRRLKLFEQSIAFLDLDGQRKGVVRAGIAKHYVDPPSCDPGASAEGWTRGGSVPVAAVYILQDQALPDSPRIEALRPIIGAQALLNESYRPSLAMAMARGSSQVAITAAILNRNPVFRLTRFRSLGLLSGTVAELFTHWKKMSGDENCVVNEAALTC